jgi:FkbM family methyltransferase
MAWGIEMTAAVSQSIRDHVRLRFPRALSLYQRHVAPRLGADARPLELAEWADRGPYVVQRTGMHGIRFERDGIWIDDGVGHLWAYEPGPLTTTMWSELGERYEQAEIETLALRLPPGGTVLDVGANVGLHSIQLARLVPGLQVHACEPAGHTFELLRRNIAKNGVAEQVRAQRVALADHPGTVRVTSHLQFCNFIVPDGATVAAGASEEVRAQTLDDLAGGLDARIDAIKCDVEGAELSVLRGAERTLARDRPTILIEVDERWAARYGNAGREVFAFLAERGYSYERFVGAELVPASGSVERDILEGSNFLFTSERS